MMTTPTTLSGRAQTEDQASRELSRAAAGRPGKRVLIYQPHMRPCKWGWEFTPEPAEGESR